MVKEEDLPCSEATMGPAFYWELLETAPSADVTPCIQAVVEVRCQGVSHFLLFAVHLYPPRDLHRIVLKSGLWFRAPASLSFSQTSYLYYYIYYLSQVYRLAGDG